MNRVPRIILDLFVIKVSFPMIIWIVLIDLMRLNCHLKMRFLPNGLVVHAQIQSIHTRLECGMPDYHDIYLQLDVLLLEDIFENFCKTCLEFYSLDPLHYYTTPELQLITDNDV